MEPQQEQAERLWHQHVTEMELAAIAAAALRAHLLRRFHEQQKVKESQSFVGPGATAESAHNAGVAAGEVERLILESLQNVANREEIRRSAEEQAERERAAAAEAAAKAETPSE